MVSINGDGNDVLKKREIDQTSKENHVLHGFLFSCVVSDLNKESGSVIILNETTDRKKILSCSCNGVITETDITDKENEFVEDLVIADILNWKRSYYSNFDWMKTWHMTWKLDLSVDQEHIISFGDDYAYPDGMELLKTVLRRYGMSIIGEKKKKSKVKKQLF